MTWSLGEAAAQAALTYFSANMGTKLTAVASRHSDSITLPEPKAYRLSDPFDEAEAEYPVLFAMPERDMLSPMGGGLKSGADVTSEVWFAVIYELSVDQTGDGTTEAETIRRMGARYAVALLEMLAEGIVSMGYEWGTGPVQIEARYGPTYVNRERTRYLSDVQVRIGAQTLEGAL